MDGALQLLEHIIAHLMTRDAERLGVGRFERGVEGSPEQNAADETAEREEAEAEIHARPADDSPGRREPLLQPLHRRRSLLSLPIVDMSSNVFGTKSLASVCCT